jgi:TPR repeat protein
MNHTPSFVRCAFGLCLALSAGAYAQTVPKKAPAATSSKSAAESVEKAVLRIICEGETAGAQVSTNGQVKGRCPIDMEIPVGTVKIRAAKKIDDDFERVFEDELELGSGAVQRVEVVLGGRRSTSAAMKRWEAAADAGDAEAMYQLGWAYQWGTSGPIDFVKSATYYGRAAEAGHPAGIYSYAGAIFSGRVVGKDKADGKRWRTREVEMGDGAALALLGIEYFYGNDGAPSDPVKAKEIFLRAAKAGSSSGWLWLSDMEKDKNKAAELRERAAEIDARFADAGDMTAMALVAVRYKFSQNSKPSSEAAEMKKKSETAFAIAFSYMQRAAATGDATSLELLGSAYRDGWYVPKNRSLAEKAFRAASEKGSSSAMSELEKMLKE